MDTSHAPSLRPTIPSSDSPERDLASFLQNDTTTALRRAAESASTEELTELIEQLDPSKYGFSGARARKVTRALAPSSHDLGELADAHTDPAASQHLPGSVQEGAGNSPDRYIERAEVDQ